MGEVVRGCQGDGHGCASSRGWGGAASTAQAVQQRGQRLLSRTRHTDHVHWTHLFPASLPRSEGRETEPGRRTRVGGCLSQYMRHHRCGFGAFRSRAEGSGVCSSLRCEPLSAEVFVRLWRGKRGALALRVGLSPCVCPGPGSVRRSPRRPCGLWDRVRALLCGTGGVLTGGECRCVRVCTCACAFLGLCVCWLYSLLVTLRPGSARSSPPPPATFPLRPQHAGSLAEPWGQPEDRAVLWKWGQGHDAVSHSPCSVRGEEEGGRRAELGSLQPSLLSSTPPNPGLAQVRRCLLTYMLVGK